MILGDKRSVRCGDGIRRTGTVIYIHPEHRFAVLEFPGVMGSWREAIYLQRIAEPEQDRSRLPYTPEEDNAILSGEKLSTVAERLGRTLMAICSRRAKLMRQGATIG